jgi:hypothetical protein
LGKTQTVISDYETGVVLPGLDILSLMHDVLSSALRRSIGAEELTGIGSKEIREKQDAINTDSLSTEQKWLLALWDSEPADSPVRKILAALMPQSDNKDRASGESDGRDNP